MKSKRASGTPALRDLLEEIRENTVLTAKLATQLTAVADSVQTLTKVVIQGNGQPSLVSRMGSMETRVAELESDQKQAHLDRRDKSGRNLAVWGIIISAVVMVVCAVITVIR